MDRCSFRHVPSGKSQMKRISKQTVRSGAMVGPLLAAPFTLAPTPSNLFVPEYPGSSQKEGREDSSDICKQGRMSQ